MRSLGLFVTLGASLLLFLFSGRGAASSDAQNMNIIETPNVRWGIYQILWSPAQFEKELGEQLAQLGGKPRYVMFFRDLFRGRGFPLQAVEICDRRDLIPVISFEPAPWHARQNAAGLAEIAAGQWDGYFRRWGQAAARWGKPVYFRFGFEMNGDWFSWGQRPDLFKKAWRRIHRLFKQAGADKIQLMFSPNVVPRNSKQMENPLTYYPGDDVVDCIGVDGYNFGDHYSRWHRWHSYQAIFEPTLAVLSKIKKPLFISEIGCADDPRKPSWIADFLKRVTSDQRIAAFIYYNYYPKPRGYPNWRLDSDETTLAVFRKWVKDLKEVKAREKRPRPD